MGQGPRARLASLAAAATALSSLLMPFAATAAATPGQADPPGKPITVMTRNLYLGADIQRPLDATRGKTGPAALIALGQSVYQLRQVVDATDFNVRGRLLAGEIARNKPDLVGLQEVAQWSHGPLELPPSPDFAKPNADVVDYDFLTILLDDLEAAGTPYEAVSVQKESDVEAPSFETTPASGGEDVRLTMRDVILKRVGDGVKVLDSGGGNYVTKLSVLIGGVAPFDFIRGYNWVDVRSGSGELRFVNTHLEAFSSGIAYAQAQELLSGPAAPQGRTTVIVCDCNSDPLNSTVNPDDPVPAPHNAPYQLITGSGFADGWLTWAPPTTPPEPPSDPGFTSGLSELVNDGSAAGFDHRIDMVFVRDAGGAPVTVDQGTITGNQLSDRDPATKLWPSDHAGVVLRLRGALS